MIDALIQGRLMADPEQRLTKAGWPFATARLSVTDREGGEHLVLLTAFDGQAVAALLALGKLWGREPDSAGRMHDGARG